MLNIVREHPNERALKALAMPAASPFKAAPIMPLDPTDPQRELLRKTHRTAAATWLYINRIEGADRLGPLPPTYLSKADDLIATGRRHPIQKLPPQYKIGRLIWDEADAAADPDHPAAMHIIGRLPDGTPEQWQFRVERYLDDHLVALGMVVDWAIHFKPHDENGGGTHPHFHGLVTARRFRNDLRKGQRQRTWLYNKAQIDAAEDAWIAAIGLPLRSFA